MKTSVRCCPLIQYLFGNYILVARAPGSIVEKVLDSGVGCQLILER